MHNDKSTLQLKAEIYGLVDELGSDLEIGILNKLVNILKENQDTLISQDEVIPENCRFRFKRGNMTVFVIEEKPQVRTITVEEKSLVKKRIALPYVIFLIGFVDQVPCELGVYFRNEILTGAEDHLFLPALPNVFDSGMVCASREVLAGAQGANILKSCQNLISEFWQSSFNYDYTVRHNFDRSRYNIPEISSWNDWVALTKRDPLLVLRLPWTKLYRTLTPAPGIHLDVVNLGSACNFFFKKLEINSDGQSTKKTTTNEIKKLIKQVTKNEFSTKIKALLDRIEAL